MQHLAQVGVLCMPHECSHHIAIWFASYVKFLTTPCSALSLPLPGRSFLLTSDHGNSDDMVQREKKTNKPLLDADTGKPLPLTSHTLAPVPVYIGGKGLPDNVVMRDDLPDAGLANITATYINLLGLQAPSLYKDSLITAA
jgi:bisphosphoglycerate-independent phosphoglycerate mutase (AlkP superfamily)